MERVGAAWFPLGVSSMASKISLIVLNFLKVRTYESLWKQQQTQMLNEIQTELSSSSKLIQDSEVSYLQRRAIRKGLQRFVAATNPT